MRGSGTARFGAESISTSGYRARASWMNHSTASGRARDQQGSRQRAPAGPGELEIDAAELEPERALDLEPLEHAGIPGRRPGPAARGATRPPRPAQLLDPRHRPQHGEAQQV